MFKRKSSVQGQVRVESDDVTAPNEDFSSVASYPDGLVVIGPSSSVSGKIDACRILDVHGVLQADVVTEMLIVRHGGGVKGTIQTVNAEIHGVVEGSLSVHEHLDIRATGRVSGGVTYKTLAIATGAKFLGTMETHSEAHISAEQPSISAIFCEENVRPNGVLKDVSSGHQSNGFYPSATR